jgi:hypothetical protein
MLELYQIAIILVGIIVYAALSRRLEASIFTLPMRYIPIGFRSVVWVKYPSS